MTGYTLLTGATGLLGRYLLRDLLESGVRVAVVIRPSKKASPQQRLESILQQWEADSGRPLPRPVCFAGDVCQPLLGLADDARDWISQSCDSIIHSAAVLTFEEQSDGEPWRTNVGGTRNVLQLCSNL